MSMHKIPLTDFERIGLENHRLPIGVPSQLSDAFRIGMAYGLTSPKPNCVWTHDDDHELYETSCGNGWSFTEGGIEENKVKFCPFCGGTVAKELK